MLETARCIVIRDLLVAWRRRSDVATALLFFVIVTSLFPLGIGAEPDLLRSIAPGVIWVAALLSCMLSLGRLFAADHADGTLEQLLLGSRSEEHTSELQSLAYLVCRLLLEKKKKKRITSINLLCTQHTVVDTVNEV